MMDIETLEAAREMSQRFNSPMDAIIVVRDGDMFLTLFDMALRHLRVGAGFPGDDVIAIARNGVIVAQRVTP